MLSPSSCRQRFTKILDVMAEIMAYPEERRPIIIGIYGIPGAGKSHLLEKLKISLGDSSFLFFEGSDVIDSHVTGGLQVFQGLQENQKRKFREKAIDSILGDCTNDHKAGIVTGHYMFWQEEGTQGVRVLTHSDLLTYTHIIYLDSAAEVIATRCRNDSTRTRPAASLQHLQRWQAAEKTELRRVCYDNNILFSVLNPDLNPESSDSDRVAKLIQGFRQYNPNDNLRETKRILHDFLQKQADQPKSTVVLDGDKTMAAVDTGTLFWQHVHNQRGLDPEDKPLESLYSSALGYSHLAFRQASLLFEDCADSLDFEDFCTGVASQVQLYPEILSLLNDVRVEPHAAAIIVTCGVRSIWKKVLERYGHGKDVLVVGGGRQSDSLVIDDHIKASLISYMQRDHRLFVTAFGDSPLDLPMLSQANHGVVVVGGEQSRSKSMDKKLGHRIDHEGLRVRQALLGSNAMPRLDYGRLPVVDVTDPAFANVMSPHRHGNTRLRVVNLSESNASKILATPMRDAKNSGPSLRAAHQDTGWHLAHSAVTDLVGTEEYYIPHVQGTQTTGYRLADEHKTVIIALMRGGEPMASGVNKAFPLASLLHAKQPEDVTAEHLKEKSTIILVDSVVNNGKTMIDFTYHLHYLAPTVPIVMVAGVVQQNAIGRLERLQATIRHSKISLVALRVSDNKYTGKGGTDTGNRLFNTAQLD